MAAIVATIYYFQKKEPNNKTLKYLYLFLWLTVITEILGSYTSIICYYKMDESLFLINDSKWLKNYWIFNVYTVISFTFYTWFFKRQLTSRKNKIILNYVIIFFIVLTTSDLVFGNILFVGYSQIMNLIGLILIVTVLSMYYYEILISDRILNISNSLPFIISVGVLIFQISSTPLFLSSQYIKADEIVFITYYRLILSYANYFLYGIIIFGIVKCYWFNKSQSKKFSSSPTLL